MLWGTAPQGKSHPHPENKYDMGSKVRVFGLDYAFAFYLKSKARLGGFLICPFGEGGFVSCRAGAESMMVPHHRDSQTACTQEGHRYLCTAQQGDREEPTGLPPA